MQIKTSTIPAESSFRMIFFYYISLPSWEGTRIAMFCNIFAFIVRIDQVIEKIKTKTS